MVSKFILGNFSCDCDRFCTLAKVNMTVRLDKYLKILVSCGSRKVLCSMLLKIIAGMGLSAMTGQVLHISAEVPLTVGTAGVE